MFFHIIIESKNKNSLKIFLCILKKFNKNKKLNLNNIFKFFQKKVYKKFFTILKSPHVNKKAQEQFEINLFTKKIKINFFQIMKFLIIVKKTQCMFFADVRLKIKFVINLKHKKEHLSKKFNPDKFRSTSGFRFYNKQIKLYLMIINFYGQFSYFNCLNSSVGRAKD